jgi:hypothetical protein
MVQALKTSWIAIGCLVVLLIGGGTASAQAPQVQITVTSTEPEVVWRYSHPGAPCAPDDYADVPVRPFMVNGATAGTYKVLWFASNSNGYFASEAPGDPVGAAEITLTHIKRRLACVRWVEGKPYNHSNPEKYDTGLWMVAPYTSDGVNVYALIHNEFHGEWTGQVGTSNKWCKVQQHSIYLPCDYWNLVAATSSDSGRRFSLIQPRGNWNTPAIALPAPYTPDVLYTLNEPAWPQGMTAQSNIFVQGGYAYILVQQFGTPQLVPPQDNGGVCLVRAPLPLGRTSQWQSWANGQWGALPTAYPSGPTPPACSPILPTSQSSPFRFSWNYNVSLSPPQFVLIGIASDQGFAHSSCPAADPSVGDSPEAFVYMTVTADLANGKFTMVTPQTCLLRINWFDRWGTSYPKNTGEAYPSLLDPSSPTLQPGGGIDLNFQYSGSQPYLYSVRLNRYDSRTNPNLYDRDVVRWRLSVSPVGQAKAR